MKLNFEGGRGKQIRKFKGLGEVEEGKSKEEDDPSPITGFCIASDSVSWFRYKVLKDFQNHSTLATGI